MNISNVWNSIVEWFNDRSDRNRLIQDFNRNARDAFIYGGVPVLLKASISKGASEYRNEFSSWINSGFRVQALSGRALSKEEMLVIGQVILAYTPLVRNLVSLGWDTLEVHDDTGTYGCRWKLIEYARMGDIFLNEYNI